jgi:hypothetical protein
MLLRRQPVVQTDGSLFDGKLSGKGQRVLLKRRRAKPGFCFHRSRESSLPLLQI